MNLNSKIFDVRAGWRAEFRPSVVFKVTGADAFSFLQGQFTQELRSKVERPAAYGLWLNQKGKVLADSYVLREAEDCMWLISLSASAAVIRERLEAYVIADDVVIEDVTSEWHGMAVGGPEAEAWLAREAGAVPGEGEFVRAGGGWVFRGRRTDGASFEWVRPAGGGWTEGLCEVGTEQLERWRIAAGIVRVPQDIGPGELPNEGGLEDVAVSYTKGCYLGQEVMARLKAMGTVRRRLVRVRGDRRGVPATPTALLQGEKRLGELRSAVADGEGGFVGLALVTKLGLDPVAPLAPEPGGDGFIQLVDTP